MANKKLLELSYSKGRRMGIFAMLIACFALWGLLNNMTDNLVPAFQRIFTMDQSRAGLVQVAFYGAYAVLAIFAAVLAEELSYRRGVLIGLAVYIIGALLYIPACIAQSFDIYFIAIFIVHDNILLVFLYIYHLSMEWIVATSTEQSCGNNIFLYLFFH